MKKALIVLLLVALSIIFFRNSITEFPSHVHAWSQADRYALALGFLNNGFDFFHPQTYNLNVQFPAVQPLQTEQGITAVDFPIHEYVVSLLMKITGSKAPIIFRLYLLLYSWVGLFFLFKLSKLFCENNDAINFITVAFAFTAPVYTYYMDGFIPSVTSIANCFIAFYFFFKYKKENSIKDFYRSIFFFTLASLGRTPFAIFLIAMIGQQFLSYILDKKINRKEVVAFAVSFLMIAGYFFYNAHLRKVYGSVFLSSIFPAKDWLDFKELLKTVYVRWFFQYFTKAHYIFLLILMIVGVASAFKSKLQLTILQKQLALQILIVAIGVCCYFLLMSRQYKEHDYYFLDSFFPVVILLLLFLLSMINFKVNKFLVPIATILFIVFFVYQSKQVQAKRNDSGPWDRYQATINNFTGAEEFLSKNNVAPDARILVIDAYSPNIPFILMNRKGYSVITTSKEEILKALNFKFNYVVIQNQFLLSDVLNNLPELKNYLTRIDGNGKITLYNYHPIEKETSLFEFLGLNKMKSEIDAQINFDDTIQSSFWSNTNNRIDKMFCNSDNANSGQNAAYADSSTEYGVTFNLPVSKLDTTKSQTILFEGDFCSRDDLKDVLISGYAGHANVVTYQQYFDVSTQVKEKNKWTTVQFLFSIDKLNAQDEIKIFLWNPKKKFVCYDNWRVRVY
ncbi:MAG: glycosyltransferase family 39 protein [Bacteroidia bacterium]